MGSEGTKANSVLTLLKPKTTVAAAKPAARSAQKPNAVNHTVLPSPTTTQNPPTTSTAGPAKSKPSPPVIQTTPAAPPKTASAPNASNKGKLSASVNQTAPAKPQAAAEAKTVKVKPSPTAPSNVQQTVAKITPASSAKTTKDKVSVSVSAKSVSNAATVKAKVKPQASVNQTTTETKAAKDKSTPSRTSTAQVASAKPTKEAKEKAQPAATVTTKPASTNINVAKKTIPAIVPDAQSTLSTSGLDGANTKEKVVTTTNTSAAAKPSLPLAATDKIPKEKATSTSQTVKPATKALTTAARGKDQPSANQTLVAKVTKPSTAPTPPIKVVIRDGCESGGKKDEEMELKPGAPIVMTHKISLVPTSCKGGCEAKMAALEGRLALLEKEMSSMKEKCACSASCPNDCSGNGKCERAKCICQQGFIGSDCSRVVKEKPKTTGETGTTSTKKNSSTKDASQSKTIKGDSKVLDSTAKEGSKIQTKTDTSVKKIDSSTKTQILLNKGKKQEVRTDRPAVMTPKKTQDSKVEKTKDSKVEKNKDSKVEESVDRPTSTSNNLKDEPRTNVTQISTKKVGNATKSATETSKTRVEQSTMTEKSSTQQIHSTEKSSTQQIHSTEKSSTQQIHSTDKSSSQQTQKEKGSDDKQVADGKTAKINQKSMYIVNVTTAQATEETGPPQNKSDEVKDSLPKSGGLGSVRVTNVSSYSFILTWSAPHGMFKNFTVVRREPETADIEEEEVFDKSQTGKNITEVQAQSEIAVNGTSSGKVTATRSKAEGRRVSMVVPGNTRSVEFSNLQANTRYVIYVYASGQDKRSKMHRVTATTGPEPLEEVLFGDLTENSFTLSWNKPKGAFTGYRITYINIVTGENHSVTLGTGYMTFTLSKLSAGTSYIVTVCTMNGRVLSDAHTTLITTVPAPPTDFQAVDVSDTKALLKWTPSLGKVDRFVISYESSKTPNVTVTVMLSANTVEHQLKGLQRGTMYSVKIFTQKDDYQSASVSTTFTTANAVKPSEVGAHYAVITWKLSTFYHSYRITYQVVGEETKQEIILDPTTSEYKLTGLVPMSRYTVLVQGHRDGHYTSVATTEFTTGKLRFPFPTECSQELLNGALQSGEVDIYPQGREGPAARVYCDMESDGGGWTVFQRRMNGKIDFYRTWNEYSTGFGNISEEFWLGNRLLHNLTSVGPVSLRVDMRSGNDTAFAHYANFSIDSEERHYTLSLSGYTGTAGDSMRYHNGRPFSARDKDPDPLGIHCSRAYMGGWWYKNCYKTNLNGLYGINSNNQGIVWIDWKGKDASIPFTEMKFRPSRFSPATHG
uniref:Tenascin n=1 Tax=Knipowitschia caucasica TaxID=637954 RepID=A0AAV2MAQ3_KNICA